MSNFVFWLEIFKTQQQQQQDIFKVKFIRINLYSFKKIFKLFFFSVFSKFYDTLMLILID